MIRNLLISPHLVITSRLFQVKCITLCKFNLSPPIMSTMSTVTASVVRDQIPSNDIDLLNHTCILVLTRGDGTPFGAAFIQEEDII